MDYFAKINVAFYALVLLASSFAIVDPSAFTTKSPAEHETLGSLKNENLNDINTSDTDLAANENLLNGSEEYNVSTTLNYETLAILRKRERENDRVERKRQARLIQIQAEILRRLGLKRKPNITSKVFTEEERENLMDLFERNYESTEEEGGDDSRRSSQVIYTKKFKSAPGSCYPPEHLADGVEWNSTDLFRLYFDVSEFETKQTDLVETKVSSATLRLYLFPISSNATNNESLQKNHRTERSSSKKGRKSGKKGSGSRRGRRNDKARKNRKDKRNIQKIQIGIYYYVDATLTKLQVKRTKPVVQREGWVSFNMKSLVKEWIKKSHKNFGMEVKVQDSQGEPAAAFQYISPLNCDVHRGSQVFLVHSHTKNHILPDRVYNASQPHLKEQCPWLNIVTEDFPKRIAASSQATPFARIGHMDIIRKLGSTNSAKFLNLQSGRKIKLQQTKNDSVSGDEDSLPQL